MQYYWLAGGKAEIMVGDLTRNRRADTGHGPETVQQRPIFDLLCIAVAYYVLLGAGRRICRRCQQRRRRTRGFLDSRVRSRRWLGAHGCNPSLKALLWRAPPLVCGFATDRRTLRTAFCWLIIRREVLQNAAVYPFCRMRCVKGALPLRSVCRKETVADPDNLAVDTQHSPPLSGERPETPFG